MNKLLLSLLAMLCFASIAYASQPGDSAPSCQTQNIFDGQHLDINQYKGKVVYVDFWASWCPPCKQSFPSLNLLRNELHAQGFEVLAINLDEEISDALDFLQQNPVNFPIAYDGQGICPEKYAVMAMPSSYIIDKKGIVREVHLGFKNDSIAKIRSTVLALLSE